MKPFIVLLTLFFLTGCSATQLREHYHTLMGVDQLRAARERLLKTEREWDETPLKYPYPPITYTLKNPKINHFYIYKPGGRIEYGIGVTEGD